MLVSEAPLPERATQNIQKAAGVGARRLHERMLMISRGWHWLRVVIYQSFRPVPKAAYPSALGFRRKNSSTLLRLGPECWRRPVRIPVRGNVLRRRVTLSLRPDPWMRRTE